MDSFLEFFFHHLEAIIMGLLISGFALAGIIIIIKIFFSKAESSGVQSAGEIEELLKKVLAQADNIGTANGASAGAGSTSGAEAGVEAGEASSEEMAALSEQLSEKQTEIEALKKDLEEKGESAEPSQELLDKLNELEARLAEYEIIEDDIADLSKYKDENEKLKKELEKIKAGGAPAPSGEPEPVPDLGTPEPEAAPPAEAKPEAASSPAEAEAEPEPDAAAAEPGAITDDLISEFEMAVSEQLGDAAAESRAGTEVGDEVEIVDPDTAETPEEPVDAQSAVDDLFNEASAEPAAEFSAEEEGSDDLFGEFVPEESAGVDTDKMMDEISGLEEVGDADAAGAGLDEALDVEKMESEAQKLDNKG